MSKLNVFVWLTVKWVNSFQTAKLRFRRNNRFWRKGLACKFSSISFHQSKWCNRKVLRKGFSVSQDCSWTENYKLQTDDIHIYWRMEFAPLIIPYDLHLFCISNLSLSAPFCYKRKMKKKSWDNTVFDLFVVPTLV